MDHSETLLKLFHCSSGCIFKGFCAAGRGNFCLKLVAPNKFSLNVALYVVSSFSILVFYCFHCHLSQHFACWVNNSTPNACFAVTWLVANVMWVFFNGFFLSAFHPSIKARFVVYGYCILYMHLNVKLTISQLLMITTGSI